ncbi:MAG TPA: DUF3592 domain-containing protein [Candidatus Melainabacteria bacterium]|nr:DUF3592 domain-containing protein [Candidatus Melainabacteria bacterium]
MLFKYLFRDWGPLLGGLIMMGAVYLMMSQFVYVQQAHSSRTWAPVDAQVVTFNSAIASGAKYDAIDELLTKIFLPEYFGRPKIAFIFTVNGVTYAGVNYTWTIDPLGPNEEEIKREHPLGSTITAYYDPANPKDCVIQTGFGPHFYIVVIGAVVIFCLGLYIIQKPRELI